MVLYPVLLLKMGLLFNLAAQDRLARERAQLEQERKAFDEKNKQFKAIMSAVKDIN